MSAMLEKTWVDVKSDVPEAIKQPAMGNLGLTLVGKDCASYIVTCIFFVKSNLASFVTVYRIKILIFSKFNFEFFFKYFM